MAEQCNISAAIVAGSEERSCVLKVDGYSRAKALLKNDECVASAPFGVGGHDWVVRYYPNGCGDNWAHCISVFLHLKSAGDAKAKVTISLLDENGEPVPSYMGTQPVRTFSMGDSLWCYDVKKACLEASVLLRDDCLTIRCDLTVIKDIHGEESRVPSSDLTSQVGARRFSAHRCVLAARSSVFKAELLGAMEESSSGHIEICDMEADVFKSLLHFIYTDSVPSGVDVVMAGHLLMAADRYDIVSLKQICEEKLCSHIDSNIVATNLALAEQHGLRRLKEACLQFLASPSNLEAMMVSDGYEHLKSSCPSVLKELIARILPAEWNAAKDIVMTMWK